jgi:5-amino-6-(5-phosphoribosylamino)uracil reductase
LAAEGVKNLLLLGGAELTASLMAAGVVDELQLTLCPLLLGGKQHWLPPNFELPTQSWQLLETRELGASELLVRYKLKENC